MEVYEKLRTIIALLPGHEGEGAPTGTFTGTLPERVDDELILGVTDVVFESAETARTSSGVGEVFFAIKAAKSQELGFTWRRTF